MQRHCSFVFEINQLVLSRLSRARFLRCNAFSVPDTPCPRSLRGRAFSVPNTLWPWSLRGYEFFVPNSVLPAPTAIQLTLGLVYRHHGRGTVCNATSIRCSEAMDSDQVGVIIVLPNIYVQVIVTCICVGRLVIMLSVLVYSSSTLIVTLK